MITLTYSQAKAILEAELDLRSFITEMNNQPKFLQYMGEITDVSELVAIYEGGCQSGAYMPAVEYDTAKQCMNECSDSVEVFTGELEIEFNILKHSWDERAITLCSAAVESYVNQFSTTIEVLMTTDY
jgi:hypothetical protein